MARVKQAVPIERQTSSEYVVAGQHQTDPQIVREQTKDEVALQFDGGAAGSKPATTRPPAAKGDAGVTQLVVAVAGIYGSFLTWAYLQEKLTTTPHGPAGATEVFKYPVFLNTIQSLFAATTGFLYLYASAPRGAAVPPVIPSRGILGPLLLVALTSSLASPFGYASLAHIDYITFLLAKSCKLLPVMLLHVAVFRRRYPLYKYLVVAAVTAGVAVFTLHSGAAGKKGRRGGPAGNSAWGLLLLGINLLFDGLTNSTQDYIFGTFQPYSGPQMMCANNLMSTAVTAAYLVLSPWLARTGVGEWFGMGVDVAGSAGELEAALAFMRRHPAVWADVLGFSACGAVGQVFIFYTLSTFSSVLLVTVTVTRKMFTMILSVVAFGHRLSRMQVLGVGLVFGGIGVEAAIARREKIAKEEAKQRARREAEKKGQ
ncbi:UAA transporter [Durotheca rogersii]|uniref:UAA transporter n=1 Tax=Durotheca rogersii TaxID=419775 RepID=UPI00221F7AB3|nr:UAA transporter [Durotheca rogersii]KAI5859328.1 UAA transporter [Durotheca rogersii]